MRRSMLHMKTRSATGKAGVMASLMAFVVLWATIAIAGVNEDLYRASRRGDMPEVQRLITKGANVNAKTKYGTALMIASKLGHREVVQVLLANGADVNAKDKGGGTALMTASARGHQEVVQVLLTKGAEVNAKGEYGWSALMAASSFGHPEVVKLLLAQGAEVNAKDIMGLTALWLASLNGHQEVVAALLSKGAEVNAKTNKEGETALMRASKEGHRGVVEVLLTKGAEVNAKDKDGRTALLEASLRGDREVVEALLANGADVNAKGEGGWTALMDASSNGHREVVRVLLAKGADVNAKKNDGRTALMVASSWGKPEVVQLLLANGSDVNAKDKYGRTALDYAARSQEIREMLIKAGARREVHTPKFRSVDWWKAYAPKLPLNMVIASLVILLVGGLWLWKKWRARGPYTDIGPQPISVTSPPSDLPPAMIQLVRKPLLGKSDKTNLIVATLFDLAHKGKLKIKYLEELVFVESVECKHKNLLILRGEGEPKYEFENLLVSTLAGHDLSERQEHIADLFPQFKKSLERESVIMGLFEEEPTKVQKWVRITGIVILGTAIAAGWLVGRFGIPETYQWVLKIFLVALGSIGYLAAFKVAPRMAKRTWQGVRETTSWSAFRMHLVEVFQKRELAQEYLQQWDTYIPYAVAFGLQNHWINCFVEMQAPTPDWFHTAMGQRPTAEFGGTPLAPDRAREAFYGIFPYISDTVARSLGFLRIFDSGLRRLLPVGSH